MNEEQLEQQMFAPTKAVFRPLDRITNVLITKYAKDLADELDRVLDSIGKGSGRKYMWAAVPEELGLSSRTTVCIALRAAIQFVLTETRSQTTRRMQSLCNYIYNSLRREVEYARFIKTYKGQDNYFRNKDMKDVNTKWSAMRKSMKAYNWDVSIRHTKPTIAYSQILVSLLVDLTPLFDIRSHKETVGKKIKTKNLVIPSQNLREMVDYGNDSLLQAKPTLMPMIETPLPWSDEGTDGGYYTIDTKFVRVKKNVFWRRAGSLGNKVKTCNGLQKVPYCVNQRVLDVAKEVVSSGSRAMKAFDVPDDEPFPKDSPVEIQEEWRVRRRAWRDIKRRTNGLRTGIYSALKQCDVLGARTFYYPWSVDSRGRIYPVPHGLTIQGDSLQRGLIQFAQGTRLGEEGAWWLAYCVASAYGHDKLSRNARVQWTMDNTDYILDVAANPMEHINDLLRMDEDPWCFLSLAFEWENYIQHGHDAITSTYYTLDATCSGYQHQACLLRDEKTAELVNLCNRRERFDIYGHCAEAMKRRLTISSDLINKPEWEALDMGRSAVKRPVMTVPYSATLRAMADYLLEYVREEQHKGGGQHSKYWDYRREYFKDAMAVAKILHGAIGEVAPASIAYMDWAKEIGKLTAKAGTDPTWTTPDGFVAYQRYPNLKTQVIDTKLFGRFKLHHKIDNLEAKPDARRNASAFAPNLIHSLDSSHLCDSTIRCIDDGITLIAPTHDCIGVPYAQMGRMQKHVLQSMSDIYSQSNILEDVRQELMEQTKTDLPEPPKQGEWDVSEVCKSKYAFS